MSRAKRFLARRVPLVSWIPHYTAQKAISDLIAGITVGLTLMPQGLAYAVLAGLEPQVGQTEGLLIFLMKELNCRP